MTLKKANDAANELAQILKIDNKMLRSVTIELIANEFAIVNVKIIITKEQWEQIGKVSQ